MKRLRKTIGICLILILCLGVLVATPIFADDGNQGQTASGHQDQSAAPDSSDFWWWIILTYVFR